MGRAQEQRADHRKSFSQDITHRNTMRLRKDPYNQHCAASLNRSLRQMTQQLAGRQLQKLRTDTNT